jgi:histidinol-phosphate phosphatase family protein
MREKFLVVRFGSLGDVILTSATVLNLRLNFPDSEIVYLTKERFGSTVNLIPGIDRAVLLPEHGGFGSYVRLLMELDRENFTTLIDLHGNFRSWLARKLVGAGRSLVYPKRRLERRRIVKKHRYPDSWPHTIDLYNSVLERLACQAYSKRPSVRVAGRKSDISENKSISQKIVVIAPGAAHPNKQWPIERFAEVGVQLNKQSGAGIIWAVTGADANKPGLEREIERGSFRQLVDCPVEELGAFMARADLVIANDSGIMHLASAAGAPVLAIFGPTHQSLGFSPRGLWDKVIEVDEPCRPCSLHGKKLCYREERYCFTRISSKQAAEEAARMLGSAANSSKALLLDRDGTVIIDKHYQADPDQIELIAGAADALKLANSNGYKIVIISNQSGVARGMFGIEDVERMNSRMVELLDAAGAKVDAVYYCPHYKGGKVAEYAVQCNCRKPAPGLAERAALEIGADFRRSVIIGDKLDDLSLGQVTGARAFLVRTGHGRETEKEMQQYKHYGKSLVFDDLMAAVQHSVAEEP